jgi:hypothetical protein
VFEHDGRSFEAGGAVMTPDHAVGYVRGTVAGGAVVNWHGDKELGQIVRVKSWPTPRSYVSSRMYQITARIDGALYTGRNSGEGMIWRGKRVRS